MYRVNFLIVRTETMPQLKKYVIKVKLDCKTAAFVQIMFKFCFY